MSDWEYIDTVFLYDGTFFGFLTIVFDSYVENRIPIKIYAEKDYENNLIEKTYYVKTDDEKAGRVFNGIKKNISFDTLQITYNAFLSGKKDKELSILKYVLAGFNIGHSINNMLTCDYVMDTMKLKKNTWFEAHRLKGLVKFRCVKETLYYAPIHPDNDVIEIVGQHFVKRLPTQDFILHDKNRNKAFIFNQKESKIIELPSDFKLPEFSDEEKLYQSLWRTFFKTIAIEERTNPKLQRSFMPKKYWQDLIETQ